MRPTLLADMPNGTFRTRDQRAVGDARLLEPHADHARGAHGEPDIPSAEPDMAHERKWYHAR